MCLHKWVGGADLTCSIIYLCSLDSYYSFKFQKPAHRVDDQLSAGVLNVKFGQELRNLRQIMIKGSSE